MNNDKSQGPMGLEELAKLSRMDATPIDFDDLIARGVLEKHGAWYRIMKKDELPEHAMRKISHFRTGKSGMVKFRAVPKGAAAQAEKLEVKLAAMKP